jgi:hypothetical protein
MEGENGKHAGGRELEELFSSLSESVKSVKIAVFSDIKNPVHASQETYYISATESRRLMLCKIEVFTAANMKNAVLWDVMPCDS